MATVRDNLVAAQALIATPERWADKSAVEACCDVARVAGIEPKALWDALDAQSDKLSPLLCLPYADIMALFDRAIAAADLADAAYAHHASTGQ
jgi:hypothetical protein